MATDRYSSPLSERYASREMQYIFSQDMKFRTWRRLWIALAEIEQELGLDITDEQIAELKAHAEDINYEEAKAREKIVRHDVMSHVYAYGLQCPKAKGIIHLGATSCYVGDNTDIIIMRDALSLVRGKLINVLAKLAAFADEYKSLPTLGFTHFQPAQPTTVGKRATLWMQEFELALSEVEHAAEKMGFDRCFAVSGQTYPRLLDTIVLNALGIIASAAMKMATDIRLLQHLKEVEEPFEKTQIGSSAMAYKRNPMRSERICSLSRYVMADVLNPAVTAGTQWFERTLDDSANKRISVAEAFLAVDAILQIYINVTDGLVVYDKVVERRVMEKLPFMATENIMMESVRRGGNRQELHEQLRVHSHAAAAKVKLEGGANDLIDRIAADDAFPLTKEEITQHLDPTKYTGRAPGQVNEFLADVVAPVLARYDGEGFLAELNV